MGSDDGEKKAAKAGAAGDKKDSLWGRYQTLLVRHPMAMNMAQSGAIACVANVAAPMINGGTVTAGSVLKGAFVAAFFVAPVISMWFGYLVRFNLHWTQAVLVDQFLFSPLFNIYFFLMWTTLSGEPMPSVWMYEPVWSTLVASYRVWLPVAVFRQLLVPPYLYGVTNNVASLIWQIILAILLKGA